MSTSCKSWWWKDGWMKKVGWKRRIRVATDEQMEHEGGTLSIINPESKITCTPSPEQKQTNDVAVPDPCPSATLLLDGSIAALDWGLEKYSSIDLYPWKEPINPYIELMKSVAVENRGLMAFVYRRWWVWRRFRPLEKRHDEEENDLEEYYDDKCTALHINSWKPKKCATLSPFQGRKAPCPM